MIVGLGNPGSEYEDTRHNAGFMAVDKISAAFGVKINEKGPGCVYGKGAVKGAEVTLVKPVTFMNRSGGPVKALLADLGLDVSSLVVIYDDCDTEPGSLRIRKKGGSGGHNGVASLIEKLCTEEFLRIKVGVGRPPVGVDTADYVLSSFDKADRVLIDEALGRAVQAVEVLIEDGADKAMNLFNR
ncbi:MAG: aminoacyl-tRNA hydrolase [Deltaproteobacteria bacterium]|nr:aminoacyl-tRNA hydrolase [Deltaproteobacteria bacterium]